MPENVQDWCTRHFDIFGEVSAAIGRVTEAVNAATRIGMQHGRLDAPAVRRACRDIVTAAGECARVVEGALALPEIPDPSSNVQFRDAMKLRLRWAQGMREAARRVDPVKLDRANAFGVEATRQGALIEADLRRAWPFDGKA